VRVSLNQLLVLVLCATVSLVAIMLVIVRYSCVTRAIPCPYHVLFLIQKQRYIVKLKHTQKFWFFIVARTEGERERESRTVSCSK